LTIRTNREGGAVFRLLTLILTTLLGVLSVVGVVFVVGMRGHSPAVRRAVRHFARTFINPWMLKTAGTPGAYASVVHHVGRTTGRHYRTPVVAESTDDGFVIALPYGTTSNWVTNVLASGSATIVNEGITYKVDHPELIAMAAMLEYFPPKDQRSHQRFRIDQCLRVRHVIVRSAPPRAAEVGPLSG
jgi:hypothetical protein